MPAWIVVLGISGALGCGACGDDESAEGGGGSGGEGATSSTTVSSSGSTDATTTSTGGTESCPDLRPEEGAACTPPTEGTCSYTEEATCPDGSFTSSTALATCSGGTWTLTYDSAGSCCPESVTQSGVWACSTEGFTCGYLGEVVCDDGGSIGGGVTATCEGGSWQTVYEPTGGACEGESTCPPEPPAPSTACAREPLDACIYEQASTCPDGLGFNVITVAKCNVGLGTWSVGTIFEGTECPACETDLGACDIDGLACTSEQEACEEGGGTLTTGTICEGGKPQAKWDVTDCD